MIINDFTMGNNKLKLTCESSLPHRKKTRLTFVMTKQIRIMAKHKFPTLDWKSVRHLCWDCKNAILSETSKRKYEKKRRGRKVSKGNVEETLASIGKMNKKYFNLKHF